MHKTLFALLVGTALVSPACSNKSQDAAAPRGIAMEAKAADKGWSGGAAGSSAVVATPPADPAVGMANQQQASGVRAGEWDDNANYRDYVKWLKETPKGVQRLDITDRQFLVVEDRDGKPVPNCALRVTGANASASLVTMASGRALLFPHAMGVDGDQLSVTASCAQAVATATLNPFTVDGAVVLKLDQPRALPARHTVDLAFVLDTTGSMAEEIEAVKTTIRSVAAKLSNDQTSVRIGLVEYKDRGDAEVTHTYAFSSDLAQFSSSVAALSAGGGGDIPEDMHAGLAAALDKLEWRETATSRLIVVIADAPPHLDYQDEKDYADASRRAAGRGIKLFTVSASGMDDVGQVVMRQMAQFTGASNMFVLRGGAGPQSTGGGDPKSSCGGTHQDYASGNLDQLIMGKVRQELSSLDGDPMSIPGRGEDENAKPCGRRLVVAN